MLQLQYYNSGLKNNHINKILNNYKIKYTHIKNEIESKLNNMIKLFLADIVVFLENIEEVAQEKRKINDYDTIKNELELSRSKIKNNIINEHKLRNENDHLQQENCLLKLKINSLNQKINNLSNNYNYSYQKPSPLRKTTNEHMSSRYINTFSNNSFISPKTEKSISAFNSVIQENSGKKNATNLLSPKRDKEGDRDRDIERDDLNNSAKLRKKVNKLSIKLSYDKLLKTRNNFNKKKQLINNYKCKVVKTNKNMSLKRFNNNNINNKKEENDALKNKPLINKINDKKKKLYISTEKQSNNNVYSPLNTVNQSIELPIYWSNSDIEEFRKTINNIIDLEMKELEKDESNIEFLLKSLNAYDNDNK
jgi:hypothetical protein